MVKCKKMNEESFAKMHKVLIATGELIRSKQEEKQGVLDEFAAESKRFFFGKISEKALASSVKKTNKELKRLNKQIRDAVSKVKKTATRIDKLVSKQAPIGYRATLSGISGGEKKKSKRKAKKSRKKKSSKKKTKKKTTKKKSRKKRKSKKKKK